MIVLAVILTLGGFAALAFAMERHQRNLLGRRLPSWVRHRWAIGGWAALTAAYAAAVSSWGAAMGTVLWIGLLSLSAAGVLLALSWWEQRRR